jgi:hypothetical protein
VMTTDPLGRLKGRFVAWTESTGGYGCLVSLRGWAVFFAIGGFTYLLLTATAVGIAVIGGVVIVLVVATTVRRVRNRW